MAVVTIGGEELFEVWNEIADACTRVDLREGTCTCPDCERREHDAD